MYSEGKISEEASTAIHSMIYIAIHNNRSVSAKEIAQNYHISENKLADILMKLVNSQLLSLENGGFRLARKKDNITLFEIYEAVEGSVKKHCSLVKKLFFSEECVMSDFINFTNKKVYEYFKGKKLSDFCKHENNIKNNLVGIN